MKLYLTELIKVTTPSENIIVLDKLRSQYGEHSRDNGGAYYDVDPDEVMLLLPQGTSAWAVHEGSPES
jgi:hypothetical protein